MEESLERKLIELGYAGLFNGADEAVVTAIWNEPGMPKQLDRLAIDPERSGLARFLAAEILFRKQDEFPPQAQKEALAAVYAEALAQDLAGPANHWGLPGLTDSLLGEHVEALGEAAVLPFAGLLDDPHPIYYVGSKEATTGKAYGYRVKDLAAFYIGRIKCIVPDLTDVDPGKRDAQIGKLKTLLRRAGLR